jgi:LPXTG-site transpeptidase (sortase) family protein
LATSKKSLPKKVIPKKKSGKEILPAKKLARNNKQTKKVIKKNTFLQKLFKRSSTKRLVKKKQIKVVKKTNHVLRDKIAGLVLLCVALFILLLPQKSFIKTSSSQINSPIKVDKKLLQSKTLENIPVKILIPNADIDLKVTPSKVVDGYWELSETTASYGLGSGLPGSKSNTVIFAHAREGLFYNLKDVKLKDTIYVFSKNKWYQYKVNKIIAIFPDQKEVIEPTKKETLTLYTCTGFNDEKRLVVTAIPN